MTKSNSNLFKLLIVAVGVLSLAVAFLPAIVYGSSDVIYNGFEVALGTTFIDLGIFGSGQIEPNFLIMLAYLLPIIAGLLAIFANKGAAISIFLFIGATILLFLITELTVTTINNTAIDVEWTMAYGLYLSIGLSIFGAFLSVFLVTADASKK